MAIRSGKRQKTKKLKSRLKRKKKILFAKKIIKRIKGPRYINSIITNNTTNNLIGDTNNSVSQDKENSGNYATNSPEFSNGQSSRTKFLNAPRIKSRILDVLKTNSTTNRIVHKIEVSYILGILNADRTLRECLDSIFTQDFPIEKYEVIIVDGGSKDKTLEIVSEFMRKHENIRLMHNPHKLSEGRGMSKDLGTEAAKGEIVIFLDHDNILLGKSWLREIIEPLNKDKQIMASQSLLQFMENDTNFLKYVNAVGVEDPFAIPYSLPAQIALHPEKFHLVDRRYYLHQLDKESILYGGANGCAFRKSVFKIIDGYTRDVDVFASMAEHRMKVAVPLKPRVYHKTASNMLNYMIKKAIYFYRFIDHEYEKKSFKWTQRGPGLKGKIRFFLMIAYNLSFFGPFIEALKQTAKTGRLFWLLHPFYVFYITAEYGLITLFKLKNFFRYQRR